jgi:hypothetical protein
LTQPFDGVRLSGRVLRELALVIRCKPGSERYLLLSWR